MKVKLTVAMDYVGCEKSKVFEVDDEDVQGMSAIEVENHLYQQYVNDWIYELIESDIEIIESPASGFGTGQEAAEEQGG